MPSLLVDDRLVIAGQHLQGEAVETLAEAVVGAVVDHDRVDRRVHRRGPLPTRDWRCSPRCAFDRRRRTCRWCCRRWRGASPPNAVFFCVALPCAGDVPAVAVDFDFGQRQRPLLAGKLDPDVAAHHRLAVLAWRRQLLRQSLEQRLDLRDTAPPAGSGSRISGIALTRSLQRPTRLHAQLPRLVGAAVGGDRGPTKPSCRVTGSLASVAIFSRSPRPRPIRFGPRLGQQPHQIEHDALVRSPALLVLLVADRLDQHAQLGSCSPASPGRHRLACGTRRGRPCGTAVPGRPPGCASSCSRSSVLTFLRK